MCTRPQQERALAGRGRRICPRSPSAHCLGDNIYILTGDTIYIVNRGSAHRQDVAAGFASDPRQPTAQGYHPGQGCTSATPAQALGLGVRVPRCRPTASCVHLSALQVLCALVHCSPLVENEGGMEEGMGRMRTPGQAEKTGDSECKYQWCREHCPERGNNMTRFIRNEMDN
jgi:hypothetical protein